MRWTLALAFILWVRLLPLGLAAVDDGAEQILRLRAKGSSVSGAEKATLVGRLHAHRRECPPDAIVNVWWDCGHRVKYVADWRVSGDGSTRGTHVHHWVGRAMATPDERESAYAKVLARVCAPGNLDELRPGEPATVGSRPLPLRRSAVLFK